MQSYVECKIGIQPVHGMWVRSDMCFCIWLFISGLLQTCDAMCNMENEIIRIKVAPSAVDSDKAGNEKEQKNWANDCKNQEN